jgi:hypothetical protein
MTEQLESRPDPEPGDPPLQPPPPGPEPNPNRVEFLRWKKTIVPEVMEVQKFTSIMLSDNPVELERQGREAEAWYGRMTTLKAYAKSFLSVAKRDNLVHKTKGETDLDREILLDAKIFEEKRLVDVIDGLVDALQTRISFCQSVMKASAAEGRRSALAA